ncbi:MAG: ABC transporter ATP-binding protein [Deltaproteobacteria bacterium]|nr:ABC transporter ATP-binding protein [Deltaproteobacteria bacterium]
MEILAKDFLELNELNKFYLEGGEMREVLRNVSLKIQEGQIVALLGRSGSGKSTLLNLLAGIDEPSSGSIRIAKTMLNELDEHQRTLFRRKNIGFVFQSFNLIPTLTVEENLLLPMELNGISVKFAKARVAEFMQELGLGDRLESFSDRLSGGEQQRVAIARALVHEPNLVLADEPTGNLDRQTGEQALGLFRELIRKAGKTMIVATHSSDVLGIADRVISLEGGELIENDAPN